MKNLGFKTKILHFNHGKQIKVIKQDEILRSNLRITPRNRMTMIVQRYSKHANLFQLCNGLNAKEQPKTYFVIFSLLLR